ncbi:MAG: PAS domain S-box protein [Bacteroidota bacterium]
MAFLKNIRPAPKTIIIYTIFSTLWILLSDAILFLVVRDHALIEQFSMVKGLIFVLTSAMLLYVVVNFSTKKHSETLDQLQFTETQFKGILDSAFDAVISVDEDQRVILFNAAAERMFGYSVTEATGKPLDQFLPNRLQMNSSEDSATEGISGALVNMIGSLDDMVGIRMTGELFPIEASISQSKSKEKKIYTIILRDVTERIKYERTLHDSEERLRMLVDGIKDYAIMMLDTKGCIVSWNNGAQAITGYAVEEIIGEHFSIFSPHRQTDSINPEQILKLAIEHGSFEEEGIRVRKDGSEFVATVGITPLVDHAGKPKGFSKIIRDITERKHAEERLRLEKQFSESLLDTLPGVFYYFDEDGKYLRWNKNLEKISGYTAEEISRMKPLDFFDKSEQTYIQQRIDSVLRDGEAEAEAYFVSKNGTKRPFYFTGSRITVNTKVHVIGVGLDISERIKTKEALAATQQKLFTTLENMTDAFVSLDMNWCYTFMNQSAGKIFNRDPKEIIGKHIWTEFPEGIGQPFQHAYERAMKDQQFIWMEEYYPPYDRWFENRIYPSGEGISIFFHDITIRKKLEIRLTETNQQLQDLTGYLQTSIEEERTRISRELHDDLGQTISALRIDLSMLQKTMMSSADELIQETAKKEIPEMTKLIDGVVLAMRKIVRDLRPEALDTLGVIGGLQWQAEEFERRTKIRCTVSVPVHEITLDVKLSTTLFRVIQESLTNIMRHSRATQVNIQLSVTEQLLTLLIQDDGIGIKEEEKQKAQSFGLLGMRERVRAIQGALTIDGAEGKGTTLIVTIPTV